MTAIGTVALVAPRYAPAIGGVERAVEQLALGLTRRGVSLEVICTDPTRQLPAVEERDGVLVRRFPTLRNDSVYYLSPPLGRWLARNAHRFDLFHAHSYHAPLALQAALVARKAHIPFIFTPYYHGTGHAPLRRLLHIPYALPGGWLFRQARKTLCSSTAECLKIQQRFHLPQPPLVIPLGIDVDAIRAAAPFPTGVGEMIVLAAGRLEHYKQVDRLIAALPHLPSEYRVVVIGNGAARAKLERMARALDVGQRLRMLDHVPDDELLAWYRTANVFVSMSRHEAFGLTVLEAAAGGAAVVASDIPAHREVAGYAPEGRVRLVDAASSPQALASAIRDAARLPRPDGTAHWSLPTWEQTVERTLACYEAVLAGNDLSPSPEAVGELT